MMSIKNKVGRPLKIDKEIKIAEHFMLSQETDAALREYAFDAQVTYYCRFIH